MTAVLLLAALSAWAAQAGAAEHGAEAFASALAREVHVPLRIETVIDRGHIEGHAVSVVRLKGELPASQLLDAARAGWAKAGAGRVVEAASGPWLVVSARAEGGFLTLQARPSETGGSEALLSVWRDPPQAFRAAGADQGPGTGARRETGTDRGTNALDRWLPAGATVLRRLEGIDGERQGATVVALVRAAVPWTLSALDARLVADGLRRDPVVRTRSETSAAEARLYRGSGRELAVTALAHPAGGTAVVLHLIEGAR